MFFREKKQFSQITFANDPSKLEEAQHQQTDFARTTLKKEYRSISFHNVCCDLLIC